MKEVFVVFCVSLALISVPVSPQQSVTVIDSPSDLDDISNTGDYVLASDINMSGETYTPPENFTGTFDGQGHTISDIELTPGVSGRAGLFLELSGQAEVSNFTLLRPSFASTPTSGHGFVFASAGDADSHGWHVRIRGVNVIKPQPMVGPETKDLQGDIGVVGGHVSTDRLTVKNVSVRDFKFDNTNISNNNYPLSLGMFGSIEGEEMTFDDIQISNFSSEVVFSSVGGVVGDVDQDTERISFDDVQVRNYHASSTQDSRIGGVIGNTLRKADVSTTDILVDNVTINSESYISAIAGGEIDDAHDITVTNASIQGEKYLGGVMVGVRDASNITFEGDVKGDGFYIGGLSGIATRSGTITDVHIRGNVSGPKSGGLIGRHSLGELTIQRSSFEGQSPSAGIVAVVGPDTRVEGFGLTVNQVYAAGEFDSGFGYNVTRTTVSEFHAYGDMEHPFANSTREIYVGTEKVPVEVNSSYYSLPGDTQYMTGLSEQEFLYEDSFSGWNFDGVWKMGEKYPIFRDGTRMSILYDDKRLVTNTLEGTRGGAIVVSHSP